MPPKVASPTITTFRVVDEAEPTKLIVSCKTMEEAVEKKAAQEKKDSKHGNKRSLTIVEHGREAKRGRDLKKLDLQWENPVYLDSWKEGYDLVLLNTDNDVRQFGEIMRHCASWEDRRAAAVDNKHFFLTILDPAGQPILTAHGKHADYLYKNPITMYDSYFKSLGWGVEYEDSPEPLPYEEWAASERKRLAADHKEMCRIYDTSYGYGKGWYETNHPLEPHLAARTNHSHYDSYAHRIRQNKPLKGFRPATINGFPVIMLSCNAAWGQEGKGKAIQWVKEWYHAQIDQEQPLRKVPAAARHDYF
jgi:hypothetical protein